MFISSKALYSLQRLPSLLGGFALTKKRFVVTINSIKTTEYFSCIICHDKDGLKPQE